MDPSLRWDDLHVFIILLNKIGVIHFFDFLIKIKKGMTMQVRNFSQLKENYAITLALIEAKADVDKTNRAGNTAIDYAMQSSDTNCIKALLKGVADTNPDFLNNKLFQAIKKENNDMVATLIEAKADINTKDDKLDSPLSCAVYKNNAAIMKTLIAAGANLETLNNNECTPLFEAIECRNTNAIRVLIEAKASINTKDKNGQHASVYIDNSYDSSFINLLIEAKANLESVNNEGNTTLIEAVTSKSDLAIKTLIEAKANLNAKNKNFKTALMIAKERCNVSSVELLNETNNDSSIALEQKINSEKPKKWRNKLFISIALPI